MGLLKGYHKMAANSLLESIIALSIISVCLYTAILVYSAVFNKNTSARFYSNQNKIYDTFFMMQLEKDSVMNFYSKENWDINSTDKGNSILINIKYSDSVQTYPEKVFFIENNEY